MESAFLDRRKIKIDHETALEKYEIEKEIAKRTPHAPTVGRTLKYLAFFGLLGGIILDFVLETIGCEILGAIIGVAAGIIVFFVRKQIYNAKCTAIRSEEARRKAEADEKSRIKFENEKEDYLRKITEARIKYGKNAKNAQDAIQWLVKTCSGCIETADRSDYIREVFVSFPFSVRESEISADYVKFDFYTRRRNNITSFTDQVGFAQALALILQFEIRKAFPYDPSFDPSDKSKGESKVAISGNDNNMVLTYRAPNANYKHPTPF